MSLRYQKPFNPINIGVPYPFTAISHEQLTLPTHLNDNRFCDLSLDLDWNQCGQQTMSNCRSSLLSPTRILSSMTPPISLTIATTRSWPFVISASHGSACTRENGILHQYRPFLIQWVSFGLLIKTVILLMLHSTPFALWTLPQWNRICEWSVIVLSTTNKRIISLSLTCKRNTTCNLYCFQNNTQVSFSNAFPLFLRYNHPT